MPQFTLGQMINYKPRRSKNVTKPMECACQIIAIETTIKETISMHEARPVVEISNNYYLTSKDETGLIALMVIVTEEELAKYRLEALRQSLRNENISYGELAELESLKGYIPDGDVELLEAAGVPEFVGDE